MTGLSLGDNSLDNAQIAKIFKDIDEADAELATLKSAYMSTCKRPRKRIRDARKHARGLNLDMAAFAVAVKNRRDQRRIEARRRELELAEELALDAIMEALGDYASTELGQAAVRNAAGADELDDLSQQQ